MKITILTSLTFLLIITKISVASCEENTPNQRQVLDMVIATIDEDIITLEDFKAFLAKNNIYINSSSPESLNKYQSELKDFITTVLLEKEAEKAGIIIKEEEVEKYIELVIKANNSNVEALEKELEKQNLSLETYKKTIKEEILKTRLIAYIARSKITVSDEDVRKYFDKFPNYKPKAGQKHLQQLFISKNKDSALSKAQEFKELISKTNSWQSLNNEYYSRIGYIYTQDLKDELRDASEKLSVGETSEIIETRDGYYIINVISVASSENDIDDFTIEAIKDEIFKDKAEVSLKKYVEEELFKTYHIDIKI